MWTKGLLLPDWAVLEEENWVSLGVVKTLMGVPVSKPSFIPSTVPSR